MEDIYGSIKRLSEKIVRKCTDLDIRISTAESCTGGMISAAITSVSGSSSAIELGFCSYSNRVKREMLGVSAQTLDKFSEYSKECVEEMAKGAMRLSDADFAVSTSGVAGPSGGTEADPVGTVYISVCGKGRTVTEKHVFENRGRDYIRAAATEKALSMLLETISTQPKGEF